MRRRRGDSAAAPGTLPATLILREATPTHGTVSARSSDRSDNRPELGINRVQSHESNRSSMSAESRTFRVLVVAPGADPAVVLDAVTAIAASDCRCVDELHVLASVDAADRLRAALLKPGVTSALADRFKQLGIAQAHIVFSRRTIHGLGRFGTSGSIADDVLDTLQKLCGDMMNDVTVVASSNAGVVGILTHSALQLVGKPTDRFFVLPVGPRTRAASKPRRHREHGASGPLLLEVPAILAERPMLPIHSYTELAAARRLARQRLSQPGILTLDGRRRAIRIDDVELPVPRLQFFWMFCLATLAPQALRFFLWGGMLTTKPTDKHHSPPPPNAPPNIFSPTKKGFLPPFPNPPRQFPLFGPPPPRPTPSHRCNVTQPKVGINSWGGGGGGRGGGFARPHPTTPTRGWAWRPS